LTMVQEIPVRSGPSIPRGAELPLLTDPSESDLVAMVRAQQPVLIEGLFRGQPIAQLATLEGFARRFGDLRLTLSQEYAYNEYESMRRSLGTKKMTLAEYRRFVHDDPRTPWMCVEGKLPDGVRALLEVPSAYERVGDPDDAVRFRFFLGNPGNCASFHFDADMRSVILHQIFGRKTVVLVPPAQSRKMLPVMNFSGWMVQEMDDEERAAFVAFAGARMAVLRPEQTLFIPTGW